MSIPRFVILSLLIASTHYGVSQPATPKSLPRDFYKVRDVIIYEDSNFHAAFPSVIRRPDGEVIVAFRRAPDRKIFGERHTSHVDPNSYLMKISSPDGLNWDDRPGLLYAHAFGGSQDPCLLQLRDSTLLCSSYGWAFLRTKDGVLRPGPLLRVSGDAFFLGGYLLRSGDGGDTWDGPFYPPHIDPERYFSALGEPVPAYNRGAMCEGREGNIFWAVAAHDNPSTQRTSVHLLVSRDYGKSWEYSAPVATDDSVSFNETSVYETPKGDLVAFLRTAGLDDQACIARSTDGGKTFQPWQKMGFKGHPLHALRLPDDRVLITYGYRHKPYGIRARILNAECTNYSTAPEIVLRDDGGTTDLGYPWAVMLDEKHLLVTYYFNKEGGTRHIAGTVMGIR